MTSFLRKPLHWVLQPIQQEAIDDKKQKDKEERKKNAANAPIKAGQYKFDPSSTANLEMAPTQTSTPTHATPGQLTINIEDEAARKAGQKVQQDDEDDGDKDAEASEKIQKRLRDGDLVALSTSFSRRLFGEFIGTGLLTFFISGLAIENTIMNPNSNTTHISNEGNAFGEGLTVMFLIYALGEVSGAHLNPIISYAFALRGHFPARHVIFYWAAQIVGAIVGAAILMGFYEQNQAVYGANRATNGHSPAAAMLFEAMICIGFTMVAINVATAGKQLGRHAALAVGGCIGVGIMLSVPYTSGSMNPARSLGPAIVNGRRHDVWPFVVGPFIGATLAVIFTRIMMPSTRDPIPPSK